MIVGVSGAKEKDKKEVHTRVHVTAREPADKRRSPASVYNTVKANPYTAPPLKEKISLSLKKERTNEEKQKVHKNTKKQEE